MRRCIFARVKFLSRVLTALNLAPSIATLASANRSSWRHSVTKRAQTLRIAGPLSLRKFAIVFVIGHQATGQPHDLDVAPGLPLKAPARLEVEVTAVIPDAG